jgi:tetratricopeptide (TPR) repeat protein
MLNTAVAAKDWDTALRDGWYLLNAEQLGAINRVDVLNIMADVCQRIGRYATATRAAETALRLASRPYQSMVALAVLVCVATKVGNPVLGQRHATALRTHVGRSAGPFEDARALLTLAELEQMLGSREAARHDLERAYALSERYCYHEVQLQAERLLTEYSANSPTAPAEARVTPSFEAQAYIDGDSQRIVSQMDTLYERGCLGMAASAVA